MHWCCLGLFKNEKLLWNVTRCKNNYFLGLCKKVKFLAKVLDLQQKVSKANDGTHIEECFALTWALRTSKPPDILRRLKLRIYAIQLNALPLGKKRKEVDQLNVYVQFFGRSKNEIYFTAKFYKLQFLNEFEFQFLPIGLIKENW